MIRRLTAAAAAFRNPAGPMPSARALPDSVRQLAKDRPPIPLPRTASPWPLVNAEGITWAEAKRRKEEAQ